MEDVIAYLVRKTVIKNEYKQEVTTETKSRIFAVKDTIRQSEFYNGGKAGIKPEFKLTTAIIDYNGEEEVELDGKRYGIYRTYEVSQDDIELYCEKKGGLQP